MLSLPMNPIRSPCLHNFIILGYLYPFFRAQIRHLQDYNISSLQKLAAGVSNVLITPPGTDTDSSEKI